MIKNSPEYNLDVVVKIGNFGVYSSVLNMLQSILSSERGNSYSLSVLDEDKPGVDIYPLFFKITMDNLKHTVTVNAVKTKPVSELYILLDGQDLSDVQRTLVTVYGRKTSITINTVDNREHVYHDVTDLNTNGTVLTFHHSLDTYTVEEVTYVLSNVINYSVVDE